jgi:hypothetical protein
MDKFPTETSTANLYLSYMCAIHVLLKKNIWRTSPSPVVAQVAGGMLRMLEVYTRILLGQ